MAEAGLATSPNASSRPQWLVVGGADKGGIVVREGRSLKSVQLAERLAYNATIEELELVGDRLHYQLLSGSGPRQGWVSIKFGERPLVAQATANLNNASACDSWQLPSGRESSAAQIRDAAGDPYAILGLQSGAKSGTIRRAFHGLCLLHHPDKGGDPEVFNAVTEAHRVLTEACDRENGGWRDLERQQLGPWLAHGPSTKGVTCILFDCFGAPPWESRRIYTGSWQEGKVRCWELSRGEPGRVRPPPRLLGEIEVGGFVNDVAAFSPLGLLSAQSAGLKPLPGESLRAWDLSKTPFASQCRGLHNALGCGRGATTADPEPVLPLLRAQGAQAAAESDEPGGAVVQRDGSSTTPGQIASSLDDMSRMIYLHYRGVRAISLWPRPESREATPHVAATVSKDMLAVSKLSEDGCGIETPAVWQVANPHNITDVNALKFESLQRLWSGDDQGIIKCWDVGEALQRPLCEIDTGSGLMTGLEVWSGPGVLAGSHSSGMVWLDAKTGKVLRRQTTKNPVSKLSTVADTTPVLFAAIGPDLMQYDTRCLSDSRDAKPKAVGQWTLPDSITGLHCIQTRRGSILVGVGCMDGKVAVFDAS